MKTDRIMFYLDAPEIVSRKEEISIERDWALFSVGTLCWTLQTYLHVRRSGLNVDLDCAPPKSGLVVVHADDLHSLLGRVGSGIGLTIICIRADRTKQTYADWEIVQNPAQAQATRQRYICLWPQPAIMPRSPERGSRVEVVAFKGETSQLHSLFHSYDWITTLAREGIEFRLDTATFQGKSKAHINTSWNDFREVDAILAVRTNLASRYDHKPASKLLNAWIAGTPALLGPESAYRALRESELDYFEVATTDDALTALRRLRDDQRLFRSVVDNGYQRARKYSIHEITATWQRLLDDATTFNETRFGKLLSHTPIGLRKLFREICGADPRSRWPLT